MTNDQLKAFIAVAEKGSFRAAAQHIYKTQPSVSAAVAALEEQFALRLFNREHYRPELTVEGQVFYDQAKRLIAQVDELESLGHRLALDTQPSLSISMTAMCAFPPGLEHIRNFCERHRHLQLNLTTRHLAEVLMQLDEGKADLAIGPQQQDLQDRYEHVELTRVSMLTVAAPGFVEHEPGSEIPQLKLRDRPQVLPVDRKAYVNVIAGGTRWYANDYMMMKALLVAGMGWARMPRHMVEAELADGKLVPLRIERFNFSNQIPIYLVRNKQRPLPQLAQALWDEMLQLPAES
ncbi:MULTISPECIES: LysR family transcriptional regulator [Pseudomonas]|uniref:LysR family transcriptional regulator n=1 Tax=Pseudomonas TaxID=286 RepID=UPI00380F743D